MSGQRKKVCFMIIISVACVVLSANSNNPYDVLWYNSPWQETSGIEVLETTLSHVLSDQPTSVPIYMAKKETASEEDFVKTAERFGFTKLETKRTSNEITKIKNPEKKETFLFEESPIDFMYYKVIDERGLEKQEAVDPFPNDETTTRWAKEFLSQRGLWDDRFQFYNVGYQIRGGVGKPDKKIVKYVYFQRPINGIPTPEVVEVGFTSLGFQVNRIQYRLFNWKEEISVKLINPQDALNRFKQGPMFNRQFISEEMLPQFKPTALKLAYVISVDEEETRYLIPAYELSGTLDNYEASLYVPAYEQ